MTAYWFMPTAVTPAEAGIGVSVMVIGRVEPTARVTPAGAAPDAVFCIVIQSFSLVASGGARVKVAAAPVFAPAFAPAPPAPAPAPPAPPAPAPAAAPPPAAPPAAG